MKTILILTVLCFASCAPTIITDRKYPNGVTEHVEQRGGVDNTALAAGLSAVGPIIYATK